MTEAELEALLTDFTNRLRFERPLDLSIPEDAALYVTGLHGDTDAVSRLRKDILRMQGGGAAKLCGTANV